MDKEELIEELRSVLDDSDKLSELLCSLQGEELSIVAEILQLGIAAIENDAEGGL